MTIKFLLDNTKKEVDKLNDILKELNKVKRQDSKTKFLKKFIRELIMAKHHQLFAKKHKVERLKPIELKPVKREIPYFKPHEVHRISRLPEKKKVYKITQKEYPIIKVNNFTLVRAVIENNKYKIIEPPLTTFDIKIINDIKLGGLTTDDAVLARIKRLFASLSRSYSQDYFEKIKYYVRRDDGLGKIALMMKDPKIKSINCPGIAQPVRIIHEGREIESDIVYTTKDAINNVVLQLSRISNITLSELEPILDHTLQNGIRLQGNLGTSIVSPRFLITK